MEKLESGKYIFTYHKQSTKAGLNLGDMNICDIIPRDINVDVNSEFQLEIKPQVGIDFYKGDSLEKMRWDYNIIANFFGKSVKNLFKLNAHSNSTSYKCIFMVFGDMSATLIYFSDINTEYIKCLVGRIKFIEDKDDNSLSEVSSESYFDKSYCVIS